MTVDSWKGQSSSKPKLGQFKLEVSLLLLSLRRAQMSSSFADFLIKPGPACISKSTLRVQLEIISGSQAWTILRQSLGFCFLKLLFSVPDIQARARARFSSSLRWSSKRSRCTPVSFEQRIIVATKMKKTTRTTDAIFFKIKIGRSEDFLAKYLIKVFVQFGRSYGN